MRRLAGILLVLAMPVPAWAQSDALSNAARQRLTEVMGPAANGLTVHNDDGDLRVEGSVGSLIEERRALQLVRSMRGVRSVKDAILVEPGKARDDKELARDVENALARARMKKEAIKVSAKKGAVTLDGSVADWTTRARAEDAVEEVAGVREVHNQLAIDAPAAAERPADSAILASIMDGVHMDRRVADSVLQVHVRDGVVTLSGTVGSPEEHAIVVEKSHLPGVTFVDDTRLLVDPAMRAGKAASVAAAQDKDIQAAVMAALVRQRGLLHEPVNVTVEDGVVTLTGSVGNLHGLRGAESITRDVLGVREVKNLLRVDPDERRSDRELAEEAARHLRQTPLLDGRAVKVAVRGGAAVLTGRVQSRLQREHAEEILARMEGVISVENKLEVQGEARRDDAQLQKRVQRALFWSPWVDADEVDVSVRDGVVTLSGEVDTVMESVAAEANAREVGVARVVNRLKVAGQQGG